ncbi:MAG: signal peptidase II [Lachnospiraceae bacterium]|nr:signal peptidase II [Lachnospiraceae bacterium]
MKKRKVLWSGLLFTLLLLALDQITKYLAQRYLPGSRGADVIPGVFQLFYLENRGAAFGMMADRQWFFIIVAFIMMLAAGYVYFKLPLEKHYHFLRAVCVLIAAGAVGNMLDRILHSYVIDFLYVSLIDFPVFNLADCYVCVGAALGILAVFTLYREDDFQFLFPAKRQTHPSDGSILGDANRRIRMTQKGEPGKKKREDYPNEQ